MDRKGNYENECVFLAIEKPQLLVWDRISKPHFKIAIYFEKLTNETTNVIFKTKEECDKLRAFAPEKNEENFDKLESELKIAE